MRPVLRALLAAVPLTAALTGLAVPAANAAQSAATTATWTVSPGGISFGIPTPGLPYLTDNVTGVKFQCHAVQVSADFRKGSGLPPNIGWVKSMVSSGGCIGDHHMGFSLGGGNTTPATWPVRANSYNPATYTAYGAIHGVSLAVSGTGCTADLTGSMTWRLQNNDDTALTLKAAKTLTASNVTGCAGAINDGDTLTLSGIHDHLTGGGHGYLIITSP